METYGTPLDLPLHASGAVNQAGWLALWRGWHCGAASTVCDVASTVCDVASYVTYTITLCPNFCFQLVGGLVVSNGNLSFVGNEVDSNEGGALYIQEFGQVKLVPGTRLQFINNTGRWVGPDRGWDSVWMEFTFFFAVFHFQDWLGYCC